MPPRVEDDMGFVSQQMRMMDMIKRWMFVAAGVVLLSSMMVNGENWPKWRGPRGDGISQETGLLEIWPQGGPKKIWSAKVGIGFSSPVAVEGKIYQLSLNGKQETLQAFDANTGKVLWEQSSEGGWDGQFPGSRSTPTIEGGRIYVFGGRSDLVCRELGTGKEIWRLNVMKETGASKHLTWGCASSPLIVGDLIYVQNVQGGPVAVAVNKTTGKIAWQSEAKALGGYAHPILIEVEGVKQLIVFGGDAVWALHPGNGKTIWTQPWKTQYDVNASTPMYAAGHLFVASAYDAGSLMLKVSGTGAQKLWEYRGSKANSHIRSRFQGFVLEGESLYANAEGTLKCMSWPDGAIKWEAKEIKLGMGGGFVRAGDKFIAISEKGALMLIKAGPESAHLISSIQIDEGSQNWSTPTLYNGKAYVKTTEDLFCLDVSGK
jgi:outer membrane protein assembly factor BamB